MAANPQPPYSCSYFSQVYKKKDRADRSMRAGHIAPEFTPDFYLGSNGFRAWNVPPDTNNVIKVGISLTYNQQPLWCPIKIRIILIDNTNEGKQDLLIAEDIRRTANDWARGLEAGFDKSQYRKYARNDYFLFRYDIEMLP